MIKQIKRWVVFLLCLGFGMAVHAATPTLSEQCKKVTVYNHTPASLNIYGDLCDDELDYGGFRHTIPSMNIPPSVAESFLERRYKANSSIRFTDEFGNMIISDPNPINGDTTFKCSKTSSGVVCERF